MYTQDCKEGKSVKGQLGKKKGEMIFFKNCQRKKLK